MCLVAQSCLTLCCPMDCSQPGSSVHGDFPGKNTGMGCHALLQGIFPTQGSNPGLPQCRQILYSLSHLNSMVYKHNIVFHTPSTPWSLLHFTLMTLILATILLIYYWLFYTISSFFKSLTPAPTSPCLADDFTFSSIMKSKASIIRYIEETCGCHGGGGVGKGWIRPLGLADANYYI